MTSTELQALKQSILDDVRVMMQTTGQVTQYIGARYVPLIADPIDWSDQKEYEPLTIVTYQGNSYTSRQFVPKGTPITNQQFWASTGNFNAQIEQYRQEVAKFDSRITAAQNSADSKAPANHASKSTEYGIGNEMNYGHVKLSDDSMTGDANSGTAATPKMVGNISNKIDKNGNAITKVLFIGDSYCDPNYPYYAFLKNTWWYKICTNMAKSGAGFTPESNTFLSQLEQAPSGEFSHIIVFGGNNDYENSQGNYHAYFSKLYNAMDTFITRAKAKYPNAQVIITGPNMDPGERKNYAVENWKYTLMSVIADRPSCNTEFVDCPTGFAQSYFANFTSLTDMHPNKSSAVHFWMTTFFNNIFAGGAKLETTFPINIPVSTNQVVKTNVHCNGSAFIMDAVTLSKLPASIGIFKTVAYTQPVTSPTLNRGFYAHIYKINSNNSCENIGLVFIENYPGKCQVTYNVTEELTTSGTYLILL